MDKLKNNESGFSIVGGLLVFVVVTIVGFTGWYVWHSQKSADKILTPANSSAPVFKKRPKNSSSSTIAKTDTKPPSSATVTLGGADYSFTAPADWKAIGGAPGDSYQDSASDILFVGEGQSLGTPNTDYVWQVDKNTASGIKVVDKSPGCSPEHSSNFNAAYATFDGFSYACNEDTTTTRVFVFVTGQGGEVPLGTHKYVINYNVPKKPGADFSAFQTILSSFKSK